MARNPILSPMHQDNDVLILEGVLAGVYEQGARYGLSKPRRDLLALTLQTMLRSMREGWEDQLTSALSTLQAGRPLHPEGPRRHGDSHLSDSPPRLQG